MIELRFVKRWLSDLVQLEVQLQYRTRELDEEYRFVWTDWKDVPTVDAERS